jgi:hypothetical protein
MDDILQISKYTVDESFVLPKDEMTLGPTDCLRGRDCPRADTLI